jgi:hypothetical protein
MGRVTAYRLIGRDGRPYASPTKGAIGGHRGSRIYGRLDCPAALRAIANGGYVGHRVFFATTADAVAAGYRPCGACMPEAYRTWKLGSRDGRLGRD